MPPCSPQGLLVSPSALNTWLGVAVHVLAAPIADVLLDALLAQLGGVRVAVLLHVGMLAVVTPPSLCSQACRLT